MNKNNLISVVNTPGDPTSQKSAPAILTREYINSRSRALRFLAWSAVLEYGDVNPTFHPEDDFMHVMCYPFPDRPNAAIPVWDQESATRLNDCMEQVFIQLGDEEVFHALHAIYRACGFEDQDGNPTD